MRSCTKLSLFHGAGAGLLVLFLLMPIAAGAEGIDVKSADLEQVEEAFILNAELEISLSPVLEDALNKGVPLNFVADFELKKPRWYWLDETIASAQQHVRLSYHALTRQYQLNFSGHYLNFLSLGEACRELGQLRDWPVMVKERLKKRTAYVAALRMKLDLGQLPKPLQVNALASKEWNLDSEWYRWNFAL